MQKLILILTLFSLFLSSCKKKKTEENECPTPDPAAPTNEVVLRFNHVVSGAPLVLHSMQYANWNNDSFQVDIFNYYISNIKLIATDNSVYTESDSYHLVESNDTNTLKITLKNVPLKNFKSIQFLIGVDSLRNVSGAQSGDLDPARNMFWSWSTGYIMAKMEGRAPVSMGVNNIIAYHIGGFSGVNNTIRSYNMNLPINATVTSSIKPKVYLETDVQEFFQNPNAINFKTLYSIGMTGANAKMVADNYADMINVTNVVN